ncbi:hypothetical protein [Nesterenkonia ebinurensis]|uniref:hypothetical protein n=1 Tax=Nesterenkonia ebinurensis TaxID=2608252 RepID=UPI00123DBF8B|nr:hypothetical protein [Nesterenkonia ebinurensis]
MREGIWVYTDTAHTIRTGGAHTQREKPPVNRSQVGSALVMFTGVRPAEVAKGFQFHSIDSRVRHNITNQVRSIRFDIRIRRAQSVPVPMPEDIEDS